MVFLKQREQKLVFHVNESLLFTNEQRIAEMKSISLEPDIIVQSYDDYVHIRGIILLKGEYKKESLSDSKSFYPISSDVEKENQNVRWIEKVIENDEFADEHIFSHRFPVD